jgi:hypothetical protein
VTSSEFLVGSSQAVDTGLDLSDPDLIADHLPLDEFAWLRRINRSAGTRR